MIKEVSVRFPSSRPWRFGWTTRNMACHDQKNLTNHYHVSNLNSSPTTLLAPDLLLPLHSLVLFTSQLNIFS